jgi:hypothetical protein
MEDTVKVIVDYHYAGSKSKKKIDTGEWELIFQSKQIVEKMLSCFGENFECLGKKMKI